VAGWPVILTGWAAGGGHGRSGRALALHSSWRFMEGMVDGLRLQEKLLQCQLWASTGGIVVIIQRLNKRNDYKLISINTNTAITTAVVSMPLLIQSSINVMEVRKKTSILR